MKTGYSYYLVTLFVVLLASTMPVFAAEEQSLQKAQNTGETTVKEAAQSQQRIDKLDKQTKTSLEEYRSIVRQTQLFEADAALMQKRVDNQRQTLDELNQAVDEVADLKRELNPLMQRMIEQLENFIQLDLPYQTIDRLEAVATLQAVMVDSELSDSQRFRSILEAWQTEIDQGFELASWRAILDDGQRRMVTYLRLGRTGLYYRDLDGSTAGFWNPDKQRWQTVDADTANAIQTGIRIANNQAAPELLVLPLPAPKYQTTIDKNAAEETSP